MNFLVTGASGFVGLNLLERLLANGHRVTALSADDIPPAARAEFARFPGDLQIVRTDVRDEAALEAALRQSEAQAVVAGAAVTAGVAREREAPGQIIEVNLAAVLKLVALCARHGVRRVVALSSSAAVGERIFGRQPIGEDEPTAPLSLYGIGKAALEAAAHRWMTIAPGMPEVTIARVAAVFGPWERDTGLRDTLSPLHAIATAAVRGHAAAPLPSGGKRDWVAAPFVAAALEWMLTAPRLEHRLYNLGAGFTWHPRDFVSALRESGLPLQEMPGAAAIPFNDDLARTRTHLDTGRLAREFQSPPALAAATQSYARWVAAHIEWFRA